MSRVTKSGLECGFQSSLNFSLMILRRKSNGNTARYGYSVQLTLEQHGFELRGSTYTWIFSIKQSSPVNVLPLPYAVNTVFSPPPDFSVRIRYTVHVTHTLCSLPVINKASPPRLAISEVRQGQKDFWLCERVNAPNFCTAGGSTPRRFFIP